MGVECCLIEPDADGRVRYPFWDEHGHLPDPPEHEWSPSLKDVVPYLGGIGPSPTPIPADELMRGVQRILAATLADVAAMHPDFALLVEVCPDDAVARLDLIYDLANGEWWVGGDEEARRKVQEHLGQHWNMWIFLRRVDRAARRGWCACWSY